MACKRKPKGTEKYFFDFMFDGVLQSNSKGPLINELIKYLLYERQQFPSPFENIKAEIKQVVEEQNGKKLQKGRTFSRMEFKRTSKIICGLDEIFSHIKQAFEYCPEIRQVILILGSTNVSPKETYLINLPVLNNPDADGLPIKTCIKTMFRQLIIQDLFENSKPIGITNLIVLLSAPRDSGIEWFLPKPNFKPQERGVQYELNLTCKESNVCGHDLSREDLEIDMSGIEPLESTDIDIGMTDTVESNLFSISNNKEENYFSDKTTFGTSQDFECSTDTVLSSSAKTSEEIEGNSLHDSTQDVADEGIYSLADQEFMWFQAPLYIKGFKDKSSKISSTDMMF